MGGIQIVRTQIFGDFRPPTLPLVRILYREIYYFNMERTHLADPPPPPFKRTYYLNAPKGMIT